MKAERKEKRPRKKRKGQRNSGGLQSAGMALNVFGLLPLEAHLLYYVGTLPFVTAFLYFWFDMSQSAYAGDRLVVWSLVLPVLFIWMKCWQAVYANAVNTWIFSAEPARYSPAAVLRLVMFTAIVQPLGFIVMPIALIFGVPFMAAGFFFQDVLISERVYAEGFFERCVLSLRCARRNPGQGFMLMWLFSPWQMGVAALMICLLTFINKYFALHAADDQSVTLMLVTLVFQIALIAGALSPFASILAGGIVLAASVTRWVLESLLGIDLPVSYGTGALLLNSSFMAVIYFVVFMLLDPLMKIAAVMRRFDYDSRSSGGDILITLKEFAERGGRHSATVALLLVTGLLLLPRAGVAAEELSHPPSSTARISVAAATGAAADGTRISAGEGVRKLDAALDETLRKPRYTWRMPKKLSIENREDEMPGWYRRLNEFMRTMAEKFKKRQQKFFDWVRRLFLRGENRGFGGLPWLGIGLMEGVFYLLLAVFLVTVLVLLLKWLRSRRRLMAASVMPPGAVKVDIHDQSVSPEDLPPDEWLELASALVARGDFRAAVRALFLGVLAKLGEADFITLRAYKSNYDYRRELELRARGRGDILDHFRWLCGVMECTWYGFVPVSEQMWRDYQLKSADLRRECVPEQASLGANREVPL